MATALHWASEQWPFVEEEVAGLRALVRPGAVCLDIGAEYGLYTWSLSALTGPTGQVHSVEPLHGPARWLSSVATLLDCGNVTVHRTALGERTQSGTMSLPRRRLLPVHGRAYLTEGTSGPGPNVEFRTSRPVPTPVQTVDNLCRQHALARVDFIKADVEGAEAAVLFGARNTLLRHRPSLLLEIEERHLAKYDTEPAELVRRLTDLDYDMYRWQARSWVRTPHVSADCRNYLFSARPLSQI
ncbi:methyltransferase FkbM [Streptomyces canus]|uniref:Methyltransferase FkbM n=1 Tax=Streptomyces canus TaxID=58343 RepID=A0A101RMN4_9ACTN|nr:MULTISPECIES: FkbM family methyltransferase [Streptomyces]KUN58460.1 methyltransferase FkbM [Streptomyces canus]MDI5912166.1 FkbM family methyltransferase [Streptomyces sp. 12257]